MLGNDMKMSAHLMITVSTAPLKYPATRPNGTPMTKLIRAEQIPTISETRPPKINLANKSLPTSSQPKICSGEGPPPKAI